MRRECSFVLVSIINLDLPISAICFHCLKCGCFAKRVFAFVYVWYHVKFLFVYCVKSTIVKAKNVQFRHFWRRVLSAQSISFLWTQWHFRRASFQSRPFWVCAFSDQLGKVPRVLTYCAILIASCVVSLFWCGQGYSPLWLELQGLVGKKTFVRLVLRRDRDFVFSVFNGLFCFFTLSAGVFQDFSSP